MNCRDGPVIVAPPSKSVAQRAILLASQGRGRSEIVLVPGAADIEAACIVASGFGATVERGPNSIVVTGGAGPTAAAPISCGESGFTLRAASALAARFAVAVELSATGSLRTRPLTMIEAPLRSLGAQVLLENGSAPVRVQGPLRPGTVTVDGSVSSQFLSGLLMTLPLVDGDSQVIVPELRSKPYISTTLSVMRAFGVAIAADAQYSVFEIRGRQEYRPSRFVVEGDWSGAAPLLVAGALRGGVAVSNLDPNSTQADRVIVDALRQAGAAVDIEALTVRVTPGALKAFTFDATDAPDLIPALVALASAASGESRIKGLGRLKHKESDRGVALQQEFSKIGISIRLEGDWIIVVGGTVRGGPVATYGDHRIAMALAVAGLRASGQVVLDTPNCVAKSYPQFFSDLTVVQAKDRSR